MSETKLVAIKKESKETKIKQYSDGTAFSNLADDGFLTGPSVKTATQAEDVVLLSDDESKTLTTLEPPKRALAMDNGAKKLPASEPVKKATPATTETTKLQTTSVANKPPITNPPAIVPKKTLSKTFVTENDLIKTLKEQSTPPQSKPLISEELFARDHLLQKMRNRLSKQIEIKSTKAATPAATPTKPLDISGAIEIPQDLILSNDIPPTPMPAIESKETELEDHDLIAILEGNDVEIHENAMEIEVCVGTNTTNDGIEEMEIVILDKEEVQQAKKEREKEIALRQMEKLPLLPKKRRNKTVSPTLKTEPAKADPPIATIAEEGGAKVKPPATVQNSVPKLPPGLTIKGQTTIRPISKKASAEPQVKTEKATSEKSAAKATTTKVSKEGNKVEKSSATSAKIKPQKTSPQTASKSSELVDSLVSDWDDEPTSAKVEPESESQSPIVVVPSEVATEKEGAAPKETQFTVPVLPVATEPRRVIKKKIIWDPSDATIPFALMVKSNRAKGESPVQPRPEGLPTVAGQMRRKRADSVAVRMPDDGRPRHTVVRKRALTPEPAQLPKEEQVLMEKVEESNTVSSILLDAKAKKRKKNEIERLLADEGTINMLYDVECEASKKDLLKSTSVDTSDEDEKLLAKTKIITDAVINQGKSPTEGTTLAGPRVRAKRASTPSGAANISPGKEHEHGVKLEDNAAVPSCSPVPGVTKKNSNNNQGPSPGSNATGGGGGGVARKRKTASTLKDWDYVYNAQGGDDAMIIRRRSNSSYSSSCASPRRLSVDASYEASPVASATTETKLPKTEQSDDGFTFAKPPNKTVKSSDAVKGEIKADPSLLANMRGKLTRALKNIKGNVAEPTPKKSISPPKAPASGNAKQTLVKRKLTAKGVGAAVAAPAEVVSEATLPVASEEVVNYTVSETGMLIQEEDELREATERRFNAMKQITCSRHGDFMEIVLHTKGVVASTGDSVGVLSDVFSKEALGELTEVFKLLEKEQGIMAVLLMSSGAHFSRGLDLGQLIQPVHKRRMIAEEMGNCLNQFLKSLISFSKPIVAAVHGDVLGMGVSILPVFDVVLAQAGSSFTMPYGYLGYLPEGMKAFTSCRALKSNALADLLMQGKRIPTTVALDYGLVTEQVSANGFHGRARVLAKKVASQSPQAIQSIKQHLRRELLGKLDFILSLEHKKQTQQWITPECQQKFKLFIAKNGDMGKIA